MAEEEVKENNFNELVSKLITDSRYDVLLRRGGDEVEVMLDVVNIKKTLRLKRDGTWSF